MRRPGDVKPWLSEEQMAAWVRSAPSKDAYQRRLAVWLTRREHLPAERVGELLQVRRETVTRWLGRYDREGPQGLGGPGRGGRRWGLLTPEGEASLLADLRERAERGDVLTAEQSRHVVCEQTGAEVSPQMVYRLLARHGWRKLAPRPRHPKADPQAQAAYKKG